MNIVFFRFPLTVKVCIQCINSVYTIRFLWGFIQKERSLNQKNLCLWLSFFSSRGIWRGCQGSNMFFCTSQKTKHIWDVFLKVPCKWPVIGMLHMIVAECWEAGEPVAHEHLQDEGPGLRWASEDWGEGTQGGSPACATVPLQSQNSGQGNTGHPWERCGQLFLGLEDKLLLNDYSGGFLCRWVRTHFLVV